MQGGVIDPWNATYSNNAANYSYAYGGKKKKAAKKGKKKAAKKGKKGTKKGKRGTKKAIVGGRKRKVMGGKRRKPASSVVGGRKKKRTIKKTTVAMPKHWGGKKGASKTKKSYEFDFHGKKTVIQASGSGRAAEKIAAKILKSGKKTEGTVTVSFTQLSEGRDQNKSFKFSVKRTAKMVKTNLPGKKTMKTYKYEKKKL